MCVVRIASKLLGVSVFSGCYPHLPSHGVFAQERVNALHFGHKAPQDRTHSHTILPGDAVQRLEGAGTRNFGGGW